MISEVSEIGECSKSTRYAKCLVVHLDWILFCQPKQIVSLTFSSFLLIYTDCNYFQRMHTKRDLLKAKVKTKSLSDKLVGVETMLCKILRSAAN